MFSPKKMTLLLNVYSENFVENRTVRLFIGRKVTG